MSELIRKEDALNALDDEITLTGRQNAIIFTDYVRRVARKIKDLPSAQPRKGKWIEHDDNWANVYYECSVCKEPFVLIDGTPTENLYNFCPNCGADMRGEQDD